VLRALQFSLAQSGPPYNAADEKKGAREGEGERGREGEANEGTARMDRAEHVRRALRARACSDVFENADAPLGARGNNNRFTSPLLLPSLFSFSTFGRIFGRVEQLDARGAGDAN